MNAELVCAEAISCKIDDGDFISCVDVCGGDTLLRLPIASLPVRQPFCLPRSICHVAVATAAEADAESSRWCTWFWDLRGKQRRRLEKQYRTPSWSKLEL